MRVFAVTITLGNRRFTLPITGASYGEVLEKAWRVFPNAETVSTPLLLNVAGNRESKNPGIFERTKHLIVETFCYSDR